jgi:hypothetical protein
MSFHSSEMELLLQEARQTNRLLGELVAVQKPEPSSIRLIATRLTFTPRQRRLARSAPPLVAVVLWSAMMIYFMIYYLTLPRDAEGHLPRISPQYAVWPYISCIGANRLNVFQGICAAVASAVTVTFIYYWFSGRHIIVGRRIRFGIVILALLSNIFLVLLSYASIDVNGRKHLVYTSLQIWFMGTVKFSDFIMNEFMRAWLTKKVGRKRNLPRPLVLSHRMKLGVSCVAAGKRCFLLQRPQEFHVKSRSTMNSAGHSYSYRNLWMPR